MALTIKDIARLAGVSTATVSLVLSDHPRISNQTKELVKSVMTRENFIPNSIARGFVKKSLSTMGMVLALGQREALRHPYVFEMLAGVEQGARDEGYHLMTLSMDLLFPDAAGVVNLWRQRLVEGFVIQYLPQLRPVLESLFMQGVPVTVIGNPGDGYLGDWIDGDNRGAGSLAWEKLREAGYRKPGFVGFPGDGIAWDRWEGFRQRCAEEGGAAPVLWTRDLERVRQEAAAGLLDCDSLVCANHYLALELLKEKWGLVTFDDLPFMDHLRPGLSTVDIDVYTLGKSAAGQMAKRLNGAPEPLQAHLPLYRFIGRDSSKGPSI